MDVRMNNEMVNNNGLELGMEPSEEFPILFGLLTESKKGHAGFLSSQLSHSRPLRRVLHASSRTRTVTFVEPDSSTPDDPTQFVTNSSSSATSPSPLLILRLTSESNTSHTHHSASMNSAGRRRQNNNQEIQVIQRRPRRQIKLISNNEDDCTPSSTTTEDEEIPIKWSRLSSLPTRDESEERQMPQLELMDSVPCQSSMSGSITPSPPKLTRNEDEFKFESLPVNENSSSVFFGRSENDRPYSCNQCDLKFKRQFSLLRHMAIHDEKRDFKCCNCNTAFHCNDNLLTHQLNCQKKSLQETSRTVPHNRGPRPTPRTLADLLDRTDHYHHERYSDFVQLQLPRGLEISEVKLKQPQENHQQQQQPSQSRRRCIVERINLADSDDEPLAVPGQLQEVYPCGHCKRIFHTFSRLIKHTADKHMKNASDGTFHFEIETIIGE